MPTLQRYMIKKILPKYIIYDKLSGVILVCNNVGIYPIRMDQFVKTWANLMTRLVY